MVLLLVSNHPQARAEDFLLKGSADVEKQAALLEYRQYPMPVHATHPLYSVSRGGLEFLRHTAQDILALKLDRRRVRPQKKVLGSCQRSTGLQKRRRQVAPEVLTVTSVKEVFNFILPPIFTSFSIDKANLAVLLCILYIQHI